MKDTRELDIVLDEVFMSDDINEEFPCIVSITKDFTFVVECPSKQRVRLFELVMPQGLIAFFHREEILNYRLSKVEDEDEVYLSDIFMHGKYIRAI
jgi:hypothetical protein